MWQVIKGYSNYMASKEGHLKVINYRKSNRERIMKPAIDNGGYFRTMLRRDDNHNKFDTVKVHRVIAQTFIPNPDNKPQVNHINGVRNDNRVENLEWVTSKENVKHSFNRIGNYVNKGQKVYNSTLTDEQVLEIRKNYHYGKNCKVKGLSTKKEIAEKYNTTFSVIKRIIQNKTWKHLS